MELSRDFPLQARPDDALAWLRPLCTRRASRVHVKIESLLLLKIAPYGKGAGVDAQGIPSSVERVCWEGAAADVVTRGTAGMRLVQERVVCVERGQDRLAAGGVQIKTDPQTGHRSADGILDLDAERFGGTKRIVYLTSAVAQPQRERSEGRRAERNFTLVPDPFPGVGIAGRKVEVHRLGGGGAQSQLAFFNHQAFLGQAQDGGHVMADKQHGPSLLGHISHLAQAFLLELRISDS